jgi:hypothetical protein
MSRIKRVDPNFNDRTNGRTDIIPHPYEDYSIAVDLSVRITNRYSCGFPKSTHNIKELNFSSNNGTLSFINGTKDKNGVSYLTTNFTDVQNTDPTSNTSETFGIESIDITYNSWLYPEVCIRFVDVRGASVMQPLEYEYFNEEASMNKALYRALFTFPYPMFNLKVKGFYGKGVNYQLACTQTDLEFDSNTGNFIIIAKFVGFMFGIYSELPMTYIASAPYTEAGKKYWQNGIKEGRFVFRDTNGNPITDMVTIPEMRLKMAQAANAQERVQTQGSVSSSTNASDGGGASTTTNKGLTGTVSYKKMKYSEYKGPASFGQPHVVVYKEDFMLALYNEKGEEVFSAQCTTGKNPGDKKINGTKGQDGDNKTPHGVFPIIKVQDSTDWTHDYKDGNGHVRAYGPYFFRLRTIVNGVENISIGIHGTNRPEKLGQRDSGGCIRLHNDKLREFYSIVKVNNMYKNMSVVILPGKADLDVDKINGTVISYQSVKSGTANFGTGLVFGERMDLDRHPVVQEKKENDKRSEGIIKREEKLKEKRKEEEGAYNIEKFTKEEREHIISDLGVIKSVLTTCTLYVNNGKTTKGLEFLWTDYPSTSEYSTSNVVKNLKKIAKTVISLCGSSPIWGEVSKLEVQYVQLDKCSNEKIYMPRPRTFPPVLDEVVNSKGLNAFFTNYKGKYSLSSGDMSLSNYTNVLKFVSYEKYVIVTSPNFIDGLIASLNKMKTVDETTSTTKSYSSKSYGGSYSGAGYGGGSGVSMPSTSTIESFKTLEELSLMESLGFLPSIRNIFELIFAHVETFMATFYDRNKNILGLLESGDSARKVSTYISDINKTDLDPNMGGIMPPYTGFYTEKSLEGSGNTSNSIVTALAWPPTLAPEAESLDEVQFILDLLSGAQTYSDESQEINRQIEARRIGVANGGGSVSVYKFMPLTLYDLFKGESAPNPFKILKSIDNVDAFAQALWLIVLLRANYFSATAKGNFFETDGKELAGQVDAVNFFKEFRDNLTPSAMEFIKTLSGETDTIIGTVNPILQETGLFPRNFAYGHESNYFPVGEYSLNTIKRNIQDKKFDKNFIIYKHFTDAPYKGDSVAIFEDPKYIDNIVKSISSEWEAASNDLKTFGNRTADSYSPEKWEKVKKIYTNTYTKNGDNSFKIDTELSDIYECKFLESIVTVDSADTVTYSGCPDKTMGKIKFSAESLDGIGSGRALTSICFYRNKGDDGDTAYNFSTFDLYKQQNNIVAKAYLFIQGVPIKEKKIKKVSLGPIPKSVYLRLGANEWWASKTEEEFNSTGYVCPGPGETFSDDGYLIIKTKNYNASVRYSRKPDALSAKNYFINWAKKEFSAIEKYISDEKTWIDKDVSGVNKTRFNPSVFKEKPDTYGKSINKLIEFSSNLLTNLITLVSLYHHEDSENTDFTFNHSDCYNYVNGFVKELRAIYTVPETSGGTSTMEEIIEQKNNESPFRSDDVRLSTYISLKTLYDKWLCGPRDDWDKVWKLGAPESDFNNFIYVDSYYHDIGYKISVNLSKINAWFSSCIPTTEITDVEGAYNYTGKTVFDFLTTVAEDTGGLLMAMPHRFGDFKNISINDLFTPYSFNDDWDDTTTSFIFMYKYKPSEHLGESNTPSKLDMNGYAPKGDGINLDDTASNAIFNDEGYDIPAFSVAFAQQNQSIFKNLKLRGENNGATEAGLQATFQVAAKGSESPRESSFYGQDLYRVFSNYSYNCGVECMGNVQITPMMYFQLDNIPMWKGAYMISKVSHQITPGNMTTNFEGYRINKHAIPISEAPTIITKGLGLVAPGSTVTSVSGEAVNYAGGNGVVIQYNTNPVSVSVNDRSQLPKVTASEIGNYIINGVGLKNDSVRIDSYPVIQTCNGWSPDAISQNVAESLWILSLVKTEWEQTSFTDEKGVVYNNNRLGTIYILRKCGTGNSPHSSHLIGAALDINGNLGNKAAEEYALFVCVVKTLCKYRIEWDQLLYEENGSQKWTHLGWLHDTNKRQRRIQYFNKHHWVSDVRTYTEKFRKVAPPEICPELWDGNQLKTNVGTGGSVSLW